MDMVYQTNQVDIGINQVIQLIELSLGEGSKFLNFSYFYKNGSGHFGAEYPWHTKAVEELVKKLDELSRSLDNDAKIALRIG